MGSSVSKYYDDLEQAEWFENQIKLEQNKSRFARLKSFISKLLNKKS